MIKVEDVIFFTIFLCLLALTIITHSLTNRVQMLEKKEKVIEIIMDKEVMDTYKLGEDLEKFGYTLDKEK